MKIAVIFEPSDGGGFTVHVPSLPGCVSEGNSIEEALANIREAFELYVESTVDDLILGEGESILDLELDWLPSSGDVRFAEGTAATHFPNGRGVETA